MNFDRNTVIGFVLLALLFFGYFYYTNREQAAFKKNKAIQDSIANAGKPKPDSVQVKADSLKTDSVVKFASGGGFMASLDGKEELVFAENELIKVAFTNKGGQPKWVELKNYSDPHGKPVRLAATDFDKFDYPINTSSNQSTAISGLIFRLAGVVKNTDGSTSVTYTLKADSSAETIEHRFLIKPNDYMLDFTMQITGADKLLTQGKLNFTWQQRSLRLEKDLAYEKQQSQIGYYYDGDYDYHTISMRSSKEFEKQVQWVAVKQQFFNTSFIARNSFSSGKIDWIVPSDTNTVVQATANLQMLVPAGNQASIPMALYYGPNDYKILKKYGMEMEDLVNLGQGMFAFVKWINRWIVLPVFDFFKNFVNSYGMVILLLTFFIRLVISPLTYSSYLSGAKMKALRPEIQKLRDKYGKDQQQMSMEQMKLFREAGVNPLGGCIPALLQIPIFFALYSFFNSNVALRGQNFLWADDLSSYDSILDFGFNIPLYGGHISLFTITACLTSFLISIYSMSMTPDQSNPVLKYMPYIFPFFLLFIFNRLPSALTWYYTVSNLVTLGLQFVIQTYIIDHEKVLAKIEETRKKPKPKSKWQERMEQMQESQKRVREMQAKNKR